MNFSSFQQRIFSAVVMAPVVLAIIYFGGWVFLGLVVICALIAFYEWGRLSLKMDKPYVFLVFGIAYIFMGMWASFHIRIEYGFGMAFLFVIMVWASDIGAYFIGKTFGGPKLAEGISPNKTWSGYGGALFFPGVFACLYVFVTGVGFTDFYGLIWVFVIGILIGVSGQAGDLLVSWFKRRVNVKDTGDIIPGHGGILDRIDSLLLCAPVFFYSVSWLMGAG